MRNDIVCADGLQKLRRALNLSEGFSLHLAEFSTIPQRNVLIEELKSSLTPQLVQIIEISPDCADILNAVTARMPENQAILFITDIERCISGDQPYPPIIRQLNLSRPKWPQCIGVPVVFWATTYATSALLKGAPDFFNWRSSFVHFPEVDSSALMALSSDLWQDHVEGEFSTEQRQMRIKELESRLAQPFDSNNIEYLIVRAEWLRELGWHLRRIGDFEDGNEVSQQAIDMLEQARSKLPQDDSRQDIALCEALASNYRETGRMSEAILLYEESLEKQKQLLGPDHPDTLRSMSNLAVAYRETGRWSEALPLYEEAFEKKKQLLGPDHPDTLSSSNNLAVAYSTMGRISKALSLHEETLAKRRQLLGSNHPDTLRSMNNLANAYKETGKISEALLLLEKTLTNQGQLLGPDHPDTLASMNNLANVYRAIGKKSESLLLLEETLARRKKILGSDHPDTLRSMSNLANAYEDAGRTLEALPLLEKAVEKMKLILGLDFPDTLRSMHNLANVYRAAGKKSSALDLITTVIAVRDFKLGSGHPDTLRSRFMQVALLLGLNRSIEAENLLAESFEAALHFLGTDHELTKMMKFALEELNEQPPTAQA